MIDIKSLIAFRDEMTKIALPVTEAKPVTQDQGKRFVGATNYTRDTGKTQKLPQAQPAPPKQVAQPKVRKFKIPKNYQAPTTLKGANYRQRGMFIQSMGYNPRAKRGDKDDWRKNKKIRGMMNEWWKDRNARRAAAKAAKPSATGTAAAVGAGAGAGTVAAPVAGAVAPIAGKGAKTVMKNALQGKPATSPVKGPPVPAGNPGSAVKLAPKTSQEVGPGGVAPTARPKAQPKAQHKGEKSTFTGGTAGRNMASKNQTRTAKAPVINSDGSTVGSIGALSPKATTTALLTPDALQRRNPYLKTVSNSFNNRNNNLFSRFAPGLSSVLPVRRLVSPDVYRGAANVNQAIANAMSRLNNQAS